MQKIKFHYLQPSCGTTGIAMPKIRFYVSDQCQTVRVLIIRKVGTVIAVNDLSSEPLLKTEWATGCNKTIILTKDSPRISLWSPGFPRQYPDNTNCFTVVISPNGYNIVLEFEELVLESEPE